MVLGCNLLEPVIIDRKVFPPLQLTIHAFTYPNISGKQMAGLPVDRSYFRQFDHSECVKDRHEYQDSVLRL